MKKIFLSFIFYLLILPVARAEDTTPAQKPNLIQRAMSGLGGAAKTAGGAISNAAKTVGGGAKDLLTKDTCDNEGAGKDNNKTFCAELKQIDNAYDARKKGVATTPTTTTVAHTPVQTNTQQPVSAALTETERGQINKRSAEFTNTLDQGGALLAKYCVGGHGAINCELQNNSASQSLGCTNGLIDGVSEDTIKPDLAAYCGDTAQSAAPIVDSNLEINQNIDRPDAVLKDFLNLA
ncbi:MAG: hypothetical protein LBO08_00725 [Rickettsiales bacterium]|jgi:hypothetical protein|nr:hypothetical protein [Rickettsiales bacterium]